jgi:flavin reductase (DIM6/NTAB) family NADH-FMN oxidoreductase RutF
MGEGWLPIDGSPIGLVTWYAPNGPVALLASWLAVINGCPPELRAGCSGRFPGVEHFPVGTDFAINVPADGQIQGLHELVQGGASGRPVMIDAGLALTPARSVHAPLLAGCVLQIECAHGRLIAGDWEPELAGDIVLLHRRGHLLDPADHPDFCVLHPLRTFFPS